jgi:REP element-mobilizing transposase RayT
VTYLVTFSCYASHLHGDPLGSVDRNHNLPGSRARGDEPALLGFERKHLTQAPYLLDEPRRAIVLSAIQSVCQYRGWKLFAAHVRQNHVHIVVDLGCVPERAAQDFKAYGSRALNRASLDWPERKRWARHSSARLLPSREARQRAIHYVAANQGETMALYVAEERTP